MINLQELYEWRWKDDSNGLVFPYYTKPFLDELSTWDLSDKIVFEYGCGSSSQWWANKCKKLYGVENNREYFDTVTKEIGDIADIKFQERPVAFVGSIFNGVKYDIVIIDCDPVSLRDECIGAALYALNDGGILVLDNFMQKSVWMPTEKTLNKIRNRPQRMYRQADHPDWSTLAVKNVLC